MGNEPANGADDFAARLALALNALNMSRGQVSATLGVHKSLVSRWLSGEVQPTSHNLARISTMIAAQRPGFNMTLWTAPREAFEASLGLSSPAPVSPVPNAPDEEPADATPSPRRRIWPYAALAAVLLLLAACGWWLLRGQQRAPGAAATASISSVAVMPFVNMSGDPAKEYLGDGISEEILNDLANTPNLRVAARTSSFSFKGKRVGIDEIARRLNVRAVLEGSVREEGDKVRIVAQLINAEDGFHLWSARYDRKLDDILAVQDEIARAIAAQLTQRLAPPKPRRQIDPKAYQDFLQAQYFYGQHTGPGYRRANELLKDALARQPDFAAAYALRGRDLLTYAGNDQALQEEGREMTATALRLEPGNQVALDTELVRALYNWDWDTADRTGRRILARQNRNALFWRGTGFLYQYMGFPREALDARRQAAALDPLEFAQRNNLAMSLAHVGRLPEALAAAEEALAVQPGQRAALEELCTLNARTGKIDRAREYARQLTALATPSQPVSGSDAQDRGRQLAIWQVISNHIRSCEIEIAFATQPASQVHALLDRTERAGIGTANLGLLYARAGDFAAAMKLFSGAYDRRDPYLIWVRYDAATPKALLSDPRWLALWQRPLLRDWQSHHNRLATDLAAHRL